MFTDHSHFDPSQAKYNTTVYIYYYSLHMHESRGAAEMPLKMITQHLLSTYLRSYRPAFSSVFFLYQTLSCMSRCELNPRYFF